MTREEFLSAISKKGNFVFPLDWYAEYFCDASDAEIGQIMRAICEYCLTGDLQRFDDRGLNVICKAMSIGIWKTTEAYIERCEQNRESGRKGGRAKAENQRQNDNPDDSDTWREEMQRLRIEKGGTF
ncbi:MAG: hypothetical protein IKG82_10965 [Oscillospiraceae bacterium]|nr:hypothetical protein [Oscillospiraceae bacterium]